MTQNDYRTRNQQLCERLQHGDRSVIGEILELNDGYVHKFVNKIKEKGMLNHLFTYDDAVQEARLALIKAAEKYDFRKGAFSTCANWYMFAAMKKSLDHYAAHIPDNHATDYRRDRLKDRIAGFVMSVINTESLDEIAYTDFPEDMPDDVFFDEMVRDNEDFTEEIDRTALRKMLEKSMSELTEREQKVLKMRTGWDNGEEMTLEAVAREMGVTRERIRQVEAKAIRKLKKRHAQKT